jgi:citrate lyase beta subunit
MGGVKVASPQDLARLERKVDANTKATRDVGKRLDTLDLNSAVTALHALTAAAPALLQLAVAAPSLIADVNQQKDSETFWRVFRSKLHPWRPLGAAIWFVILAAVTAGVWNMVDAIIKVVHGHS